MTLVLAVKAQEAAVTSGYAEVLRRKNIIKRSAVAGADGKATITLPGIQVASLPRYLVYESFKIYSDSSTLTPTITLYEAEVLPQNFVGGSDRGDLNEWTEYPALYTTDSIIVQWTGADVGANCYMRAQVSDIELVPVRI